MTSKKNFKTPYLKEVLSYIEENEDISIRCQCELLEVNRSTVYYKPAPEWEKFCHYAFDGLALPGTSNTRCAADAGLAISVHFYRQYKTRSPVTQADGDHGLIPKTESE